MTPNGAPSSVVLGGALVLLVLVLVWRAGARRGRRTAANRTETRVVSVTSRVLTNAVLITTAQWLLLTHVANPWGQLATLLLPALITAHTLTRALLVIPSGERRGRNGS
ncbi:hypothetical protein [Actinoalloteichus caeruleus]|uniref:hypothetical protein n=1 Tax=Actinoalloteichus cyanogriseus TaxID=2893586 RepID=UPI0004A9E030|nr:hypothetical protein [Actinoalloteichus caeruleus]